MSSGLHVVAPREGSAGWHGRSRSRELQITSCKASRGTQAEKLEVRPSRPGNAH
eukprot:CAMPEP_0174721892 /NCGR_PEP_ID=MMETSP1094-20130205/37452_1 /TAXON_ID=156173 /ORGANISM="Chrysochromulina brevifilum, Strain UTEX LB 985" /LENGTH=53 /DNA_ID=CAMNT_0015922659 /DNA_START=298 /DNA_END=456 /DNA_ORIENTATION=+